MKIGMTTPDARRPPRHVSLRHRYTGGHNQAENRTAGTSTAAFELRLRRVSKASVVALATLAEHKDPFASQHILRVSRLTDEIALTLQRSARASHPITDTFRNHLRVASMLHDVGKVTIPDGILQKPGRLTPEERTLMQKHSQNGRMILERAARLSDVGGDLAMGAEIAGYHHEKWDGSGYPAGLKGAAIPLSARIVAVADVFDALTHRRAYKDAWPGEEAIAYIADRAGSEFDPVVVDAFLDVMRLRASVTVLRWDDAMSVGVEDLDNDHRVLIDLINQLATADHRRDPIIVEAVLDELVDYTVFHFDKEEVYMEQAGYPDLAAHRQVHAELTRQVLRIREKVLGRDRPSLGDEVLNFLSRWLREHILRTDALYRPYLVGNAD